MVNLVVHAGSRGREIVAAKRKLNSAHVYYTSTKIAPRPGESLRWGLVQRRLTLCFEGHLPFEPPPPPPRRVPGKPQSSCPSALNVYDAAFFFLLMLSHSLIHNHSYSFPFCPAIRVTRK